jgi:hypothetical protein
MYISILLCQVANLNRFSTRCIFNANRHGVLITEGVCCFDIELEYRLVRSRDVCIKMSHNRRPVIDNASKELICFLDYNVAGCHQDKLYIDCSDSATWNDTLLWAEKGATEEMRLDQVGWRAYSLHVTSGQTEDEVYHAAGSNINIAFRFVLYDFYVDTWYMNISRLY